MSRRAQTPRRSWRRLAAASIGIALAASMLAVAQPAAAQSSGASILRIAGENVFELAANAAGGSCSDALGSHSVALASGENWPDALAGAALDRPLLLTKQDFLPAATRAYLEPCKSHPKAKMIILGGPAAVSENVAETLRTMGYDVDRFAGEDRYATARQVARVFAPDELDTVYLASGANFADAVAAAPSVTAETPLILTTPDQLHKQAHRFLTDSERVISSVTILGGRSAISTDVEAEIRKLNIAVSRIAGADRYETAALIARRAINDSDCHPVLNVAVASGTNPFGGLAAGAVRSPCEPLLLAPAPSEPIPETLTEFGKDWSVAIGGAASATVTGLGSNSVISTSTLSTVANQVKLSVEEGSSGDTTSEVRDWDALSQSVVRIICATRTGAITSGGSGFVVGDGRQFVTSRHVVYDDAGRSCGRIVVQSGGTFERAPTQTQPVSIVRTSETHDLALLAVSAGSAPLPTVNMASESLQAGERLTALGYPPIGGQTMTLTTGRYSGAITSNGATWIKTDTPLAPGSSGSPVFNDEREVVGVTTAISLAFTENDKETVPVVGTLSWLAASTHVVALLDGQIGSPPR